MYIIYTIRYAMVVMLFPISYYLPLFYPYIIRTILSCHGHDYIIQKYHRGCPGGEEDWQVCSSRFANHRRDRKSTTAKSKEYTWIIRSTRCIIHGMTRHVMKHCQRRDVIIIVMFCLYFTVCHEGGGGARLCRRYIQHCRLFVYVPT